MHCVPQMSIMLCGQFQSNVFVNFNSTMAGSHSIGLQKTLLELLEAAFFFIVRIVYFSFAEFAMAKPFVEIRLKRSSFAIFNNQGP